MHICPDEVFMFMMALPFVGSLIHWLRHKLRGGKPCSKLAEEGSCSLAACEHSKSRSGKPYEAHGQE